MVNALLGGEIDAAVDLPAARSSSSRRRASRPSSPRPARWNYMFWNTATSSRSDERVRQAMRLIMDRQQMVDLALAGYGRVGNDMWSIYDPAYPKDLPQRTQDIEQAKSLLKQAGYDEPQVRVPTRPTSARHGRGSPGVRGAGQGRRRDGEGQEGRRRRLLGRQVPHVAQRPRLVLGTMYLSQAHLCEAWNEPHWDGPS